MSRAPNSSISPASHAEMSITVKARGTSWLMKPIMVHTRVEFPGSLGMGTVTPIRLETADFAIVGPDERRGNLWTILFDVSRRRRDWPRPVTGCKSKASEEGRRQQTTGRDYGTP